MVETGLALYESSMIVAPLIPATAARRSCPETLRSPRTISSHDSPSTSPTAAAASAVCTLCRPSKGMVTCNAGSRP